MFGTQIRRQTLSARIRPKSVSATRNTFWPESSGPLAGGEPIGLKPAVCGFLKLERSSFGRRCSALVYNQHPEFGQDLLRSNVHVSVSNRVDADDVGLARFCQKIANHFI